MITWKATVSCDHRENYDCEPCGAEAEIVLQLTMYSLNIETDTRTGFDLSSVEVYQCPEGWNASIECGRCFCPKHIPIPSYKKRKL
jgi:hypothetical protein